MGWLDKYDWDLIPKFVINRRDKPERQHHTMNQLDKSNLSNFVTICNAKEPDSDLKNNLHNYISEKAYQNIKNINSTLILPNLRSVALTNSHKDIWKYILNNNINHALIIEDDIEISDSFLLHKELNHLYDITSKMPRSLPKYVIFNGSYHKSIEHEDYLEYEDNNVYQSNNNITNYASYDLNNYPYFKYFPNNSFEVVGCHFYYINQEMAKILLDELKITTYQIDIEISKLSKNEFIKNKCTFLNVETNSIMQSKKFNSTLQPYKINSQVLSSTLNLPTEISNHILSYFPECLIK